VRINDRLPTTATNKILKRALISAGVTAHDGVLWSRAPRGTRYAVAGENADGPAASVIARQ
jgi:fatty-acyl-CoA synthase